MELRVSFTRKTLTQGTPLPRQGTSPPYKVHLCLNKVHLCLFQGSPLPLQGTHLPLQGTPLPSHLHKVHLYVYKVHLFIRYIFTFTRYILMYLFDCHRHLELGLRHVLLASRLLPLCLGDSITAIFAGLLVKNKRHRSVEAGVRLQKISKQIGHHADTF